MKTSQDSASSLQRVKKKPLVGKPLPKGRIRSNKKPKVKKIKGGFSVAFGVIAASIATGGLIVGGIWLGILTLIDPNAIIWLNQFLPEWTRIPVTYASPPQTLATIEDEIRARGLIPGEPLYLDSQEAFLLPILASVPNCYTNCTEIFELRVYEPNNKSNHDNKSYWLVTELPISAPEDDFVFSSQTGDNADASRSLPLQTISRFEENVPAEGLWFKLSGQMASSSSPLSYGQVIHYNPDRQHLSVMLQWQSPNQLQPNWQQVTGSSTPEFVVDKTVGLEPQFKVYQLKPRQFVPNPIALEEVSLSTPALESQVYRDALLLARNGLWSQAWQLLKSLNKDNWPAAAQAQMDVIQLHAQITQAQSKKIWASPSSSILAHLIDGRWGDALVVFQNTPIGTQLHEIAELLKTDSGRLWERVEAALKVNPNDQNIKAWGALMIAAKQDSPKAIAWLQKQQLSPSADNSKIYQLLELLDIALAKDSFIGSHLSKIIGNSQQVENVNLVDWLQPTHQAIPIQLEPKQVWYEVRVAAFHDGKRWQYTPFSNLKLPTVARGKQLWRYLGLDTDSRIQITLWTQEGGQESKIASVKAASFREGVIHLLAAGEALPTVAKAQPTRLLAHTEAALRWLDPNSTSLWELNQRQPEWIGAILPVLRRELVNSGREAIIPVSEQSQENSSLQDILEELANWSVRPIDLTGNNQPEAVLTIYENRKPRTLIFADTGELLYSEFSRDASTSLTAIADLEDGKPPALLINDPSTYSLKRWSVERQRFE